MHKKLRIEHSGDNNNNNYSKRDMEVELSFKDHAPRKSLEEKRQQVELSRTLRLSKLLNSSRMARFVLYTGPTAISNAGAVSALYQNVAMSLSTFSTCEGYSQYLALYSQYRVVKIGVKHEWVVPPFTTVKTSRTMTGGDTDTSSGAYSYQFAFVRTPEFAFWADNSGNSPIYTSTQWEKILNRENLGYHRGLTNYFEWFPRPKASLLKNTSDISETAIRENPWISTGEPGVQYLGANIYLNGTFASSINGLTFGQVQKLIWTVTMWVEFKDPTT